MAFSECEKIDYVRGRDVGKSPCGERESECSIAVGGIDRQPSGLIGVGFTVSWGWFHLACLASLSFPVMERVNKCVHPGDIYGRWMY